MQNIEDLSACKECAGGCTVHTYSFGASRLPPIPKTSSHLLCETSTPDSEILAPVTPARRQEARGENHVQIVRSMVMSGNHVGSRRDV